MITTFLLFWLCSQLDAPVWYFILIAISIVIQLVEWGIEIGQQMGGDDYDS